MIEKSQVMLWCEGVFKSKPASIILKSTLSIFLRAGMPWPLMFPMVLYKSYRIIIEIRKLAVKAFELGTFG